MRTKIYFLLYFFLGLTLYFPTRHAGFVHDAVSWGMQYDQYGFSNLFQVLFNDNALHPVYHFVTFTLYKVFGIDSLAWYFIMVFLHATVATSSYRFFSNYLNNNRVAFWGSLLFLISPYQTEVVVWRATLHYLVAAICILASLNFYLDYSKKEIKSTIELFLNKSILVFLIGLLSLEITLIVPFLISILILTEKTDWSEKWKKGLQYVVPQFVLIALFFIATKVFLGSWTGHYGTDTHLNFLPETIVPNFLKHSFKLLTFGQYALVFNEIKTIFAYFTQKNVIIASSLAFLGVLIYFFYTIQKKVTNKGVALILMTMMAIFPVVNLFVYFLTPVQNDRLTYVFSIFFYTTLVYGFSKIHRFVLYVGVAIFCCFSAKYLIKNAEAWKLNNYWVRGLMQDFRWRNNQEVYILSCFDNNAGTVGFHTERPTDCAVRECLNVYRKDLTLTGKYEQIYMYNTYKDSDIIERVEKLGKNKYLLVIPTGTWFWRSTGEKVKNLSTEIYDATIDEWGTGLIFEVKQKNPNAVFIYQKGNRWEELKFED